MNKQYLIGQLEAMQNAKRVNRLRVANLVLNNPDLLPFLIEVSFETDNKLSIKAAWSLELVLEQQLDWITPYLDYFTTQISTVVFGSAVRSFSKICNFIAIAYTSKNKSILQEFLQKKHIDAIIETGFDWMISNHKVAVKAYTMNALALFGKNYDWVHEELKLIIQQNIIHESAAYKARGKMTLLLINKKINL
ncbi:adenylosuccinate lyase [Lutibacter holmesii]|uniref:Adenylosuccinate lyase n=1 Tax=Lutibacter holmesii TaxID=1137985 RepID=A0ABW3WLF1_9FLAO